MKMKVLPLLVAVLLSMACAPPAANTPANANANANTGNTNSNSATTTKAAPTKEALEALETQAFEAWSKKDGKFFEGFLSDNFVSVDEKGQRMGKADVVKMISTSPCDIKNHTFSDERVVPVGNDAAVILIKVTSDYTCGGKKGPSPVTSASVYVRSGDAWKAAYHNEVPIVDPATMKKDTSKKPPPPLAPAAKSPANANAANSSNTATATSGDSLTDSLMALEKKGWEAWKARDQKALEDSTPTEVAYVDPLGTTYSTKADVMKAWVGPTCDIKSVSVTDGKATQIAPDSAILTFRGNAEGTCDNNKLGPLWGTGIFVKTGDTWKMAFLLESPA